MKYALKELLKDIHTADEILKLTVCEPAMGSAAFLNEAIDQLAEEYLQRKQRELGRTIPHADYAHEKQRVKMYIADLNVFDPVTVAPAVPRGVTDLPGGGKRLAQRAVGFAATVVGGEVTILDGVATGATPGRLVRNRLAADR